MNLVPPEQYKLCSNSACKKSEHCLRQLCYRQLTKNDIGIYVLNPMLFPKENEECPYFKTDKILSVLQMREASFPVRPANIHKNLQKTRSRGRNQIRKIHRRL